MAWSDAARAAAAEARRMRKGGAVIITKPRIVNVNGKAVKLKGLVQMPSMHFPERVVKIGGKLVRLKAFSVRGMIRSRS